MAPTSTEPLSVSGSSADEVLLGREWAAIPLPQVQVTSVLVGYSGDDTITIDGAGDKTVDGGPGADTLVVSYGFDCEHTRFLY